MELLDDCDTLLQKCDAENKELMIIVDLYSDVMKASPEDNTRQLILLCSLYQLDQLIDEPTKVTNNLSTLIDLISSCVKENFSAAGVVQLGISDHSLIYAVRKLVMPKTISTVEEVIDYKFVDAKHFIGDISKIPWYTIQHFNNPNDCWRVLRGLFNELLERLAPMPHKRTRGSSVPWITPQIKGLMRSTCYQKSMP